MRYQAAMPFLDNSEATLPAGGAKGFVLRSFPKTCPRAIVIGASTGGPQALSALLEKLAPDLEYVPVFIVLHMPQEFSAIVAAQIEKLTGLPAHVAIHGEQPRPGHIYLAPGSAHLRILRLGSGIVLSHGDGPPENFCKPAVDVLFRSAARAFGRDIMGIILTGMGSDGLLGSRAIVEAGGSIISQDEESSVVWGMPGSVAQAGLSCAILPIEQMAALLHPLLRPIRKARP